MSWPENDPYLHELRRKWDEGHFRQDADSVYGIDEAIDEAIEEITSNDNLPQGFGEGQTLTGTIPSIRVFNPFLGQIVDHIDQQFGGEKTCRICRLTSVNDPCDDCSGRWRRSTQIPSPTGFCAFCQGKSPSVICMTCVERVLRDGLG